jgi:DNA helicase HerA-like ATPase
METPIKAKDQIPEFIVSRDWPFVRADQKAKDDAVQALVANHTLIVGQSRSGKTNAARRIIEEMLVWTDARIVILDPNADFKSLAKLSGSKESAGWDARFAAQWEKIAGNIAVASSGATGGIYWGTLTLADMAGYLKLTPTGTFAEYRHLDRHFAFETKTKGRIGSLKEFLESEYFRMAVGEDLERYKLRVEELFRLRVWAESEKTDLNSLFGDNQRAIAVDLSMEDFSTENVQVRMITAARTLEVLWRQGEKHRKDFLQNGLPWAGTVVVIDEGHLFAPPETEDLQQRLVSEKIQRFADQGKKLNLYLMVVTQQPGKLHVNVLSEFNNRIIMRVNERGSLTALEKTFGGIPKRYDGALTFNPGEALIEGALLCDESPPAAVPRGIKFEKARTIEGGGTPKPDWAIPRMPKST